MSFVIRLIPLVSIETGQLGGNRGSRFRCRTRDRKIPASCSAVFIIRKTFVNVPNRRGARALLRIRLNRPRFVCPRRSPCNKRPPARRPTRCRDSRTDRDSASRRNRPRSRRNNRRWPRRPATGSTCCRTCCRKRNRSPALPRNRRPSKTRNRRRTTSSRKTIRNRRTRTNNSNRRLRRAPRPAARPRRPRRPPTDCPRCWLNGDRCREDPRTCNSSPVANNQISKKNERENQNDKLKATKKKT